MTLILREPEIIALLVRKAQFGDVSRTVVRLVREGFDHLVATGQLDLKQFLSDDEITVLKAGQRRRLSEMLASSGGAPCEGARVKR
jgi:hypothetical protein